MEISSILPLTINTGKFVLDELGKKQYQDMKLQYDGSKPVTIDIPKKTSSLSNDARFCTMNALEPYASKNYVSSFGISHFRNDARFVTMNALEPYASKNYLSSQMTNLDKNLKSDIADINKKLENGYYVDPEKWTGIGGYNENTNILLTNWGITYSLYNKSTDPNVTFEQTIDIAPDTGITFYDGPTIRNTPNCTLSTVTYNGNCIYVDNNTLTLPHSDGTIATEEYAKSLFSQMSSMFAGISLNKETATRDDILDTIGLMLQRFGGTYEVLAKHGSTENHSVETLNLMISRASDEVKGLITTKQSEYRASHSDTTFPDDCEDMQSIALAVLAEAYNVDAVSIIGKKVPDSDDDIHKLISEVYLKQIFNK